MSAAYVAHQLVDAGERHLRRRAGGQDHAVALKHAGAIVLAVADGVSRVNGQPSRTEVGAALVAELAARAAHDATLRGLGPSDVRQHVAATLVRHLLPLWASLGRAGSPLLHCTLVLAATTPEWTTIWCLGDGAWGASGSLAHGYGAPRSTAPVACYGRRWDVHGRRHEDSPATVAGLCRGGDVDAVALGLEAVLEAEGPAIALYVATDGLGDEPGADDVLRRERWTRDEVSGSLARPEDCDDLAIAWATEVLPGAAGLAGGGAA
nr:protein phosphatase 2C domain-containing protein [Nannocystis sp. ILAH1]